MASTRTVAMCLSLLLPAAARAGQSTEPDPNLNLDPSVDDCSVAFAPDLTQSAFRRFAREFGSVSAFKQASAPTTLGRRRLAVDVEDIFFRVEEKSPAWNDTFVHPNAYHPLGADKSFPKLRLRYGVTDDVDVGAYYTLNPNANYGWLGLEAKVRVLEQRDAMPITLAVRGAYTKTLYVRDMNMHVVGADVSAGRTFWNVLTPYLGVGTDAVLVRETSDAVDLRSERVLVPHATAGVEVRYWHVALGAEAQVAALTSYQAQVSAVF